MNKTLIALAIAAALPVAAQADATFSGSLQSKYKTNTGAIDTDARLQLNASEVLANGMTATATFAVLADSEENTEDAGTASLSGDFGALTAGDIDADGAFQAGDIAGVVGDTTESTSSTASSVYGIHYAAGDAAGVAGLSVAAQVNANTDAAGADGPTKSHQIGASYEVTDDLKVGFSSASRTASPVSHGGVQIKQTVFGAAYTFGDLVVSAGKSSDPGNEDALISVTYTLTTGPLEVKTQVNSDDSDYQIDISYAVSDSITIASEIDKGNDTSLVATYTSGNMTAIVASTDDGTLDASVGLDYGNADLTLGRVGAKAGDTGVGRSDADAYTHVTYKVAF